MSTNIPNDKDGGENEAKLTLDLGKNDLQEQLVVQDDNHNNVANIYHDSNNNNNDIGDNTVNINKKMYTIRLFNRNSIEHLFFIIPLLTVIIVIHLVDTITC